MRLIEVMPAGDGTVLRECFCSRRHVIDQGGVIVATTIDRGALPINTNARITYGGTEVLFNNVTRATFRLRFRMQANNNAAGKVLMARLPAAANDNQFYFNLNSNRVPAIGIASGAADLANYFTAPALTLGAEYDLVGVYDGTLAAGSRGQWYSNGLAVATAITGTLPTSMRTSASALTVYNLGAGSGLAPDTDFLLRELQVWNRALSAAEVADVYTNRTYLEVV